MQKERHNEYSDFAASVNFNSVSAETIQGNSTWWDNLMNQANKGKINAMILIISDQEFLLQCR